MTHPLVHLMVELGSEPGKPQEPSEHTTKAVVASMLTENTGRHMLDSGGAYGRNWEHNQQRDFEQEPEVAADWRHGWIDITLNLYHFLTNTLEYEPELDRLFEEWCNEGERARESWFVLQEEFIEGLQQASDSDPDEPFATFLGSIECNPFTGDNLHNPWTVNTYNHESLLSQTIQYQMVGDLVFLQVHGGCDVRGGYTQPRVFRVYEEWPSFLDDQRATIQCDADCSDAGWYTDDGYHWYYDGSTGYTQLEEYPAIDLAEEGASTKVTARRIVLDAMEALGWGDDGHLPYRPYHNEDNYSLCPLCTEGRLKPYY